MSQPTKGHGVDQGNFVEQSELTLHRQLYFAGQLDPATGKILRISLDGSPDEIAATARRFQRYNAALADATEMDEMIDGTLAPFDDQDLEHAITTLHNSLFRKDES